jgi:hypothetical protein
VIASGSFQIFEIGGPGRQAWLALLDSWSGWEVFAHPDYLNLYHEAGHRPICVVYRCSEGQVIYPLILRDLRATACWGPDGEELYDTVSPPYGYGGPFIEGEDIAVLAAKFFQEYKRWAESQNVVSEYMTFSPKEGSELPYPGEVAIKMPSIVRTLDLSAEEIFRDYKDTLQRHIRGAERAGVSVEVDLTGERSHHFFRVYEETVKRTNADASYYMNMAFLDRLNRTLSGYFAYFYALLDGRVISTELVLVSSDSAFFFRGGTLADAFYAKPNHLLKHHIILWSRAQGKRFYILGGGNGAEDSLFRYKRSFAPGGTRPLRVGKWILDQRRYDHLVAVRRAYEKARGVEWIPKPDYFPAYRAPSEQ